DLRGEDCRDIEESFRWCVPYLMKVFGMPENQEMVEGLRREYRDSNGYPFSRWQIAEELCETALSRSRWRRQAFFHYLSSVDDNGWRNTVDRHLVVVEKAKLRQCIFEEEENEAGGRTSLQSDLSKDLLYLP
ncbi:unnamed protein product, partial [Prorocentrum cordatum]